MTDGEVGAIVLITPCVLIALACWLGSEENWALRHKLFGWHYVLIEGVAKRVKQTPVGDAYVDLGSSYLPQIRFLGRDGDIRVDEGHVLKNTTWKHLTHGVKLISKEETDDD